MNTFLLYGAPGAGKTTLACTAPYPILLIDSDCKAKGMNNLTSLLAEENKIEIKEIDVPLSFGNLTERLLNKKLPISISPMGYIQFCDIITNLETKPFHYKTIVIDSLTSLEEHLRRFILFLNKSSTISMPGWEMLRSSYSDLFDCLKKLKVENLIVIAHDKIEKNELTGRIEYKPLVSGSTRDNIGMYFNEVYYCYAKKEINGRKIWGIQTFPEDEKFARSSFNIDNMVNPNISSIINQ